jgi:hypothetical protein
MTWLDHRTTSTPLREPPFQLRMYRPARATVTTGLNTGLGSEYSRWWRPTVNKQDIVQPDSAGRIMHITHPESCCPIDN